MPMSIAGSVKIEQKGYKDVNLYFDKATGLPVKAEITVSINPNAGDETISFLFSNYKENDGVKHFTKIVVEQNQKTLVEVELSNIRHAEQINADLFAKP